MVFSMAPNMFEYKKYQLNGIHEIFDLRLLWIVKIITEKNVRGDVGSIQIHDI